MKHVTVLSLKGKAVPQHTYGGAGGGEDVQLLLIHDLETRWGEWSSSRPGRALPPGTGHPVPIGPLYPNVAGSNPAKAIDF
jgi:hypothetical protein